MDRSTDNRTSGQQEPQDAINPARVDQNDLPDSPHDAARLKGEITTIDLPDVKDIPGQEFVHVAPLGELADTTISSADEEGDYLFAQSDRDNEVATGNASDVTDSDRIGLQRANTMLPTTDDNQLLRASMDSTDFEGTPLNEGSFGEARSTANEDLPQTGAAPRSKDVEETL